DRPQRPAGEAARRAGMAELAREQALDRRPDEGQPRQEEDRAWEAVERQLRPPRRRQMLVELASQGVAVGVEAPRGAPEQPEDRVARKSPADERRVHSVAGERGDEAGGVADEQDPPGDQPDARPPQRQPVAAQALDRRLVDSVLLAEP